MLGSLAFEECDEKIFCTSLAHLPAFGNGPKGCASPEGEGAGLAKRAEHSQTNRTKALQARSSTKLKRFTEKAQIELNQIRDEIKEIKKKKKEEDKHRYYYIQREIYNKNKTLSKVEIASYFIYLNKAGFNGMYRENLKGHFNIPKGDLKDINIDEKKLRQASKILNQNVQIRCASYNEIDALARGSRRERLF
uniref:site-specific DNA-methyltransferase (adenine-specific) n=1 Tax=Halimeda minima TaxID=170427 RepID=A0A386AYY1_9CHLO|nr:hypothetical protein [Halimeda minima]